MLGPFKQPTGNQKWRRGFSEERLAQIARDYDAWTIVFDVPVSERKSRHMLFDQQSEYVMSAKRVDEIFLYLGEVEAHSIILRFLELPYPVFSRVADAPKYIYRSRKNG